jgi:hypothetical protein
VLPLHHLRTKYDDNNSDEHLGDTKIKSFQTPLGLLDKYDNSVDMADIKRVVPHIYRVHMYTLGDIFSLFSFI